MKYFDDPGYNAAFECCVEVLAELIEKYADKVLDTPYACEESEVDCEYMLILDEVTLLRERSACLNDGRLKAYRRYFDDLKVNKRVPVSA